MRRFALAAGLLTLGLTLGAIPATAQGFVGAGVTTPMGDFGDGAKLGWIVNAGFRPWQSVDKRASIWAEGLYGSFPLQLRGGTHERGRRRIIPNAASVGVKVA